MSSQMDFFPTVVVDRLQSLEIPRSLWMRQASEGQVRAFVVYQEPSHLRIFFHELLAWEKKKMTLNYFKRFLEPGVSVAIQETWEKISRHLLSSVDKERIYSDRRTGFCYENRFYVKARFTFGLRHVHPGTQHVYQLSTVPIACYVLDETQVDQPIHREFQPKDYLKYECFMWPPHAVVVIPSGVSYMILCLQKTCFAVDILSSKVPVKNAIDYRLRDPFPPSTSQGPVEYAIVDRTRYSFPPPSPLRKSLPTSQGPVTIDDPDPPLRLPTHSSEWTQKHILTVLNAYLQARGKRPLAKGYGLSNKGKQGGLFHQNDHHPAIEWKPHRSDP